jgi:general secretion pathway protein D
VSRRASARVLAAALACLIASCGPRTPSGGGAEQESRTNATAVATNQAAGGGTNAPPTGADGPATPPAAAADQPPSPGAPPGAGATGAQGAPAGESAGDAEGVQVAFQGANVDMVVQWLAQTTGKSVVKHPQVQCQLTIVSSRKVTTREAIDLVYQALSVEGFNAVETSNAILILPEGKDLKMSPEMISASEGGIPEGRQRLIKIFTLEHVSPAELREKIRPVLSDKATIDTDDRAGKLIITDFNDNLRLVTELIEELDVTSVGDSIIEVIPLRYAQADEVSTLVGLIINGASGGGGAPARPPPPSPGGPSPMAGPAGGSGPTPASFSAPGGSGEVRVWPDKTGNRLIISTPRSRLQDVRKLVEILDRQKPDDVAVRVIPLKHVQAVDLVKEIAPLYQRMSGQSLKDRIDVAANERSNSLIVLSSELNYHAIEELVAALDTDHAQELVIQTFPLKNADAQDVARQLQELSEGQDSGSRFPYYIFYSSSQGGSTKKMSVVADRRRNAIVVQAPPAQMPGIVRMIRELDEPVEDDSLAPRIFALKYVSAVDIEDVLNQLFLKREENRPYWYYYEEFEQEPDRDVGRLYGKVRITSEPYSNTLIVTSNSKENLAVVEDILRQLDVPSQAGETTLRVALRFAKASTLANNLNILFARNGSPQLRPSTPQAQPNAGNQQQQQQGAFPAESNFELGQETDEDGYYPWLGGQPDSVRTADGRTTARQVSDLIGRVRVVPDLRSNSLLVSANAHLLPQILRLIQDLDAPTAQVLIEARIVEVSTDALDKLGVRWSPDGSQVFTADDYDNSLLGTVRGRYVRGFGEPTSVNVPGFGDVGSTISSLRSGILDATVNLDILIQFLRRNTDATVLAEPQINIADNEMGRLFVGQQVPFINRSQTTDVGALNQSFEYKAVGVILEVTPHINTSGDVALRIRAEASAIQPGQTLFGGAILDTRTFRTDITARSGEILVLGGIIQKQISDTVRKVPFFGDIPGLGWAFKKKDKTARDVELMVFLRPKVTRTPEEARALLDELDQKTPLLRPWKEGPIHPAPREERDDPSQDAAPEVEAPDSATE